VCYGRGTCLHTELWRCVVSMRWSPTILTFGLYRGECWGSLFWQYYSQKHSLWYPFVWKLGEPYTPLGCGGKDRSLVLLVIYWFVGYLMTSVGHGLIWVTSPTVQYYLHDLYISLPGIKLIICATATLWPSYLASWYNILIIK